MSPHCSLAAPSRKPHLLRIASLSFCALALLFLLMPSAFAQGGDENVHVTPRPKEPPKLEVPPGEEKANLKTKTYRKDVDLVLVNVTVTDPMNRLVTGLEKENFQLFEGTQAQEIKHFSSEDTPISLGVIFDLSGSMKAKIDKARDAVIEFFKTANPQDEFFLITFADKPEILSGFTRSVEDIQGRLVYTIPEGRTALLDAIYLGMDKMRQAQNSRKALLVISDGGDNRSRYTQGELKSVVKEADVQIYSIGIFDPNATDAEEIMGPAVLSDISDITGGRLFRIDDVNDLADTATKIGIELRNQYMIGYRPTNPIKDGNWRKIKVKLAPPKGLPPLHVYAKAGYYAPTD
jgi:Ca-activated chloride channel homolog